MQFSDLLRQVHALQQELDALRPLDADAEQRVLQKLRLGWNYHSNRLEGGRLTYGETKALLPANWTRCSSKKPGCIWNLYKAKRCSCSAGYYKIPGRKALRWGG